MLQLTISKSTELISKANAREFIESIAAYMLGVYEKEINEIEIEIWLYTFEGNKISDVMTALKKHVGKPAQGRFPPKPCDIVALLVVEDYAGINGAYLPPPEPVWV